MQHQGQVRIRARSAIAARTAERKPGRQVGAVVLTADMTSWTETVLWWHVYPLGFTGAPIRPEEPAADPVHRLPRIEAWLDHVVELGLNGILLGPVFASETHGYDTVDYFRIDPRLGDEGDLDRLIAAARERGIRVLLDGVFNHVGRAHPSFQALTEAGPDADTAELFRVDWNDWTPGAPIRADVFEGHDALVALNHDSPAVPKKGYRLTA